VERVLHSQANFFHWAKSIRPIRARSLRSHRRNVEHPIRIVASQEDFRKQALISQVK
jgi:hypothetical protein